MKKLIFISIGLIVIGAIVFLALGKSEFANSNRGGVDSQREISEKLSSSPSNSDSFSTTTTQTDKVNSTATSPAEALLAIEEKSYSTKAILDKHFDYGVKAPVKADANAQTASVFTALQNPEKYPERLSVAIQPKPFDIKAYKVNPDEYLNIIEPARVFQCAQPEAGVTAIERISEKFPVINQTQSTTLKVKAIAKMPVTFTSFDLGRFENELTSITVKADDAGFASCVFTGSKGTIGRVNILASCPLTSGQVKFVVDVK